MTYLTATTAAANFANVWNATRQADISATAAFEVALNAALTRTDCTVARVSIYHREIFFSDGSILTVLDQKAAREAGLTDFDYAYKSQDQLC